MLLADKSDRDRFIERLRNELETMRYKAYLGTHQTKQYVRLLRRSKQQTRGVARSVVEKQEELSRWTEPVGGHVARARNQVEVENTDPYRVSLETVMCPNSGISNMPCMSFVQAQMPAFSPPHFSSEK